MPKKHRAESLLEQRRSGQSDWQFIPAHQLGCALETYDEDQLVEDRERGGYWLRERMPSRPPVAPRRAAYSRQTSAFSDFMNGVSHIAKGLERIDQATGGGLDDFFRQIR